MSRNIIFVLMYHRHKFFDLVNENLFSGNLKACVGSRDSVVGIGTGYALDYRRVVFREFSLLHAVQTGSGVHPTSYPMGTGGSFPGGKEAGGLS
jgi:hypothetical protein